MKLFAKPRPPLFSPELTFPEEVRSVVEETYARAQSILEYGSGGSTLLAARLGRKVRAVESDAAWAEQMTACLAREAPGADARVLHCDIGRTGKWGRPLNARNMEAFYRYPLEVWDGEDFSPPDVVLVDGRFRVACFCTVLMRIENPVTVLFDDYETRQGYHRVEKLQRPVRRIGRMAVFEVTPGKIPPQDLTWVTGSFFKTTYAKR
ncbi:hypothetical protein C8N32_103187 [Rhodovulum imhoffii]|uniref:Methyltransferase family protein n=1 Tax=Rhodovulum imhoffii TaxID=365340 RepID=A0A2T5BUZ2_9RHOB|nr:hypothetical protein [Rhodovulum imhoffii]PTN03344.1 hypothetical protein C8N32_103187 [Rhodovulum imhoffii]